MVLESSETDVCLDQQTLELRDRSTSLRSWELWDQFQRAYRSQSSSRIERQRSIDTSSYRIPMHRDPGWTPVSPNARQNDRSLGSAAAPGCTRPVGNAWPRMQDALGSFREPPAAIRQNCYATKRLPSRRFENGGSRGRDPSRRWAMFNYEDENVAPRAALAQSSSAPSSNSTRSA
jgi:hypothetical protein